MNCDPSFSADNSIFIFQLLWFDNCYPQIVILMAVSALLPDGGDKWLLSTDFMALIVVCGFHEAGAQSESVADD